MRVEISFGWDARPPTGPTPRPPRGGTRLKVWDNEGWFLLEDGTQLHAPNWERRVLIRWCVPFLGASEETSLRLGVHNEFTLATKGQGPLKVMAFPLRQRTVQQVLPWGHCDSGWQWGENRGPSPFTNFQKQGCVCYDGVSSQIDFVLLSSRTLLEKPVGMEQIYSNKAKYIHVYIIACFAAWAKLNSEVEICSLRPQRNGIQDIFS